MRRLALSSLALFTALLALSPAAARAKTGSRCWARGANRAVGQRFRLRVVVTGR